jgi:GNAT superfamily N-acetyltransferase
VQIAALPAIERAAAERFRGWNVPDAIMREATPSSIFEAARAGGLLWVALDRGGNPVGFAYVESTPRRVHLKELDVHPDHGRRGIGTALLRAVERWAIASERSEITLTTFRDVPWNAPFYEALGFELVAPADLDAELKERLDAEAERGLDPARRVAMRLRLRRPTSASS